MELELLAGIALNIGAVGWIHYNLGEIRSDVRGIVFRLQRMEDAFRLKPKKGDE